MPQEADRLLLLLLLLLAQVHLNLTEVTLLKDRRLPDASALTDELRALKLLPTEAELAPVSPPGADSSEGGSEGKAGDGDDAGVKRPGMGYGNENGLASGSESGSDSGSDSDSEEEGEGDPWNGTLRARLPLD